MIGPILGREWLVSPRRMRFYAQRVVFVAALFSLVCTMWLLLAGMQQIRNVGDLSRFGSLAFQLVAPMELVVVMFLAAVATASSVSQEKDRRTLILLLLTRLTSTQIVMGKHLAAMLGIANIVVASLPLLLLISLMGGVSIQQVFSVLAIVLVTALVCASLGTVVGFWREKTFQTLAVTLLAITAWCVLGEVIANGVWPMLAPSWAEAISPFRAVLNVCQPLPSNHWQNISGGVTAVYSVFGFGLSAVLCSIAISQLRVWNPSRELRLQAPESDDAADATEALGTRSWKVRAPRPMWKNPVLWREMRTWAYGRKLLFIRLSYVVLFLLAVGSLYWSVASGAALQRSRLTTELIPVATKILAPFFVVSLVMLNALAVNSITNERDGQALDLLLVTQISPSSFLLGKLLGVLYVAKEMVMLPLVLCIYLWWQGGLSTENLVFTVAGLLVLDIFVAILGIHCGMNYGLSRTAIGTSLGTVFFLLLGVVVCMMIMISFRGSFSRQLPPFLVIILGGGTGLFVALGNRNPSPAIALAAFSLPFLTFFSITSFILRNQELTVFSVIVTAYGFASLAMLIPALSEFDFAIDQSRAAEDES